jgi:hypothetical protein
MFYRGDLEKTVLEPIRRELALAGQALLTKSERNTILSPLPVIQIEEAAGCKIEELSE